MAFLSDNCTFCELTQELLDVCSPFTCGSDDLDDFFANDAVRYAKFLMGKTYCFRVNSDPLEICLHVHAVKRQYTHIRFAARQA